MKDLNLNGTATFYYKNAIPYTAIPKEYLKDKALSLKAKGLLTVMYSMPDEWNYTLKGLSKITNVSIKSLRTTIQELERNYYLWRKRKQKKNGQFYYEYIIDIARNNHVYNLTYGDFNYQIDNEDE